MLQAQFGYFNLCRGWFTFVPWESLLHFYAKLTTKPTLQCKIPVSLLVRFMSNGPLTKLGNP